MTWFEKIVIAWAAVNLIPVALFTLLAMLLLVVMLAGRIIDAAAGVVRRRLPDAPKE